MQSLVIIPTYNERENIRQLVRELHAVCPDIDLLIVDDSSPDGTGEIANRMAKLDRRIAVIHRDGKLGLGTAYITGFKYALERDYDRIVEMDADFSHRPEDLPRLLEASHRSHVVIGSRNIDGGAVEDWSLLRKAISRGGSLFARVMLGISVRDATSGFKCFRREVLESIDLDSVRSNGYAFQVEMNYLCEVAGFQIREVPITFPNRKNGVSKMSHEIVLEAASRVFELRKRGTVSGVLRPIEIIPQSGSAPTPMRTSVEAKVGSE